MATSSAKNTAKKKKAARKKSGARAATSARPTPGTSPGAPTWTFLSNHSHVLICLHREPDLTVREVAQRVGITERSVQRIIGDLEDGGYLTRERVGLRNHYIFDTSESLRHPIEAHCQIGDLIDLVENKLR